MDLEGKVALVTGASRGVGAATAVALAQAGCDVACAARSTRDAPQRTPGTIDDTVARVEAAGRKALAVPTNLAVDDEVVRMVATTVDHFGRLDILVNNAAITFIGDLDIPLKRFDLVLNVDMRAPFVAMREAIPHMVERGEGAIVNLSSAAGLYPYPGLMAYGMAKIALERLTVDAARQLAKHRIACNVFRIDIPCASEGFLANAPGADTSTWEPTEVPAEGIVWVLRQPPEFSGRRLSMYELRRTQGIMKTRLATPTPIVPPLEMVEGIVDVGEGMFREPYEK
jgi:NAD(P)-dependent dehydrogenase (short-subunit alcohol dehydrogenase family)